MFLIRIKCNSIAIFSPQSHTDKRVTIIKNKDYHLAYTATKYSHLETNINYDKNKLYELRNKWYGVHE